MHVSEKRHDHLTWFEMVLSLKCYHVFPCVYLCLPCVYHVFTMFFHVFPCFSMFFHVFTMCLPCCKSINYSWVFLVPRPCHWAPLLRFSPGRGPAEPWAWQPCSWEHSWDIRPAGIQQAQQKRSARPSGIHLEPHV